MDWLTDVGGAEIAYAAAHLEPSPQAAVAVDLMLAHLPQLLDAFRSGTS